MANWAREAFGLKTTLSLLDGREGSATCAHSDPRIRPVVGKIRKDSRATECLSGWDPKSSRVGAQKCSSPISREFEKDPEDSRDLLGSPLKLVTSDLFRKAQSSENRVFAARISHFEDS